jgi:hypothetical protein
MKRFLPAKRILKMSASWISSFKVVLSDPKRPGHIKTRQRSFEIKEGRFTAFLGLFALPGLVGKKKRT